MEIFEHEIPDGSKLYFGESARAKRRIERVCAELLEGRGFSEIVTPFFSYHQHLSVAANRLLRFSDTTNQQICLRADSTVDVVRIATKRLKNGANRYFYIQPVFTYPSVETHQIGAEILEPNSINECIATAAEAICRFDIKPNIQLSNIEIPRKICEILDLPITVFETGRLELLLAQNQPWLTKLANITSLSDIDSVISLSPSPLCEPLNALKATASTIFDRARTIFAPLYYSKMRYYDRLFFRFIDGNKILASGGDYEIDGISGAGFAIFTDNMIENTKTRIDYE